MGSHAEFVLVNTRQVAYRGGLLHLPNPRNPPLDVAYCAAVLERAGFTVRVVEANLLRLSHEETANEVAQHSPIAVILNSNALDRWNCPLPTVDQPARLAATLKLRLPDTAIVLMGPHGTARPEWVMRKCTYVDMLVRGEPEETVLRLCEAVARGENPEDVVGLSYRSEQGVVHNPDRPLIRDLDSLPWPAYHLLPMDRYGPLGSFTGNDQNTQLSPASIVLSSRGCPYRCAFCFLGMLANHQHRYRTRSPEDVVQEIAHLAGRYGVRAVYFHDLNFCVQRERVMRICGLLSERGLKVAWGCETRFDNVDRDLLLAMKAAGCMFVNFGLESGSQSVLDANRKGIRLEQAEDALRMCREAGVQAGVFTLYALPGEDVGTVGDTVEFLVRNGVEPQLPPHLSIPVPYPGTALHEQAERQFGHLEWDQVGAVAGRVGTEILDQVGTRQFQMEIRRRFFASKHGRFAMLKPGYHLDVHPRLENAFRRVRLLSPLVDVLKGAGRA